MMAHPHPPLSPFGAGQIFDFLPTTNIPPDFLAPTTTTRGQPPHQSHDRPRSMDPPAIPPLPPMPAVDLPLPPEVDLEQPTEPNADAERPVPSSDPHDHSESESDEEPPIEYQWHPIEEDTSEPHEDELAIAAARGERSAVDEAYWQRKAYFDLKDPELVPGEEGRIDWLIENYNGTKENPNKDTIMMSEIVSIGGLDWRIKFYPRGNDTDYLSVYLECLSMQSDEREDFEDFADVALPALNGIEQLKRRKAVSVQVCMVMYNPAEPRTFEKAREAFRFTKSNTDYGWTRFGDRSRYSFYRRDHGKRQAMIRNDKLAFTAYVRIIHDPSGCMWARDNQIFADSLTLTGLRPFQPQMPMFAAELPLMHFSPFRKFMYGCKDNTRIVFWLQTLLHKMLTRKCSRTYGEGGECVQSDTISWLRFVAKCLRKETSPATVTELIGTLNPSAGGAVAQNRLKTKHCVSIQRAVDAHPTPIEKPALLTLELERQEFDKTKRRWEKLTNRVEMENEITVSGTRYTLYAFATHCGDLESNTFNLHVRPNGPSRMWYRYSHGSVRCLTHKQAVGKYSGYDEPQSPIKPKHSKYRYNDPLRGFVDQQHDPKEVAHVVMYVREDYKDSLTAAPATEEWDVPKNIIAGIPPKYDGVQDDQPPATAVYEKFSEAEEAAAAEQEAPPDVTDDIDPGYATPNCWIMDGEDVVMSDIEDSVTPDHTAPEDEQPMHVTIDVLGREWYDGDLLKGEYHGTGHLICTNGDEYTGTFSHGLKSGTGKIVYAQSGNSYEGEWLDDQPHGRGKEIEAASGNVFEGGWQYGKKHGDFVLKGTMTDDDKGCCSICYDQQINTAFYDCGHVVACKDCAARVDICPICRKRVMARLELFGVKMSFE